MFDQSSGKDCDYFKSRSFFLAIKNKTRYILSITATYELVRHICEN
ncbi:hypothetical protein HMPREF9166_2307 [Selenomonas sp. oral taxon 149 str. 67H29BP]|nr:hypothetical protein HMPREF9166_2307 [Selenomonas sp. oral taxon 149 str. 67H29BP]